MNDKSTNNNNNNTETNLNQNYWLFNLNDKTLSCSLTKCLISSLRQYLRQHQIYRIQLKKNYEQLNKLKTNLELTVNWYVKSLSFFVFLCIFIIFFLEVFFGDQR